MKIYTYENISRLGDINKDIGGGGQNDPIGYSR